MDLASVIERERAASFAAESSSKPRRLTPPAFAAAVAALSLATASCTGSCEMSYEQSEGSHVATPAPPPLPTATDITREEALKVYAHFRDACLRDDAKALWALLDDGTRNDSEARARGLREDIELLRNAVGYTRAPESFTGFEYHAFDMRGSDGLCANAKGWTADARGMRGSDYMLIVSRGGGSGMALFLHKDQDGTLRCRPTAWATP